MSLDTLDPRLAPFKPGAVESTPREGPSGSASADVPEGLALGENENIASILARLEHVPGRQVAIVAPAHHAVLRNPVSMRLLQRKAEDLGIEVSIISSDGMTRQLSWEAGFGCFPDLAAFERDSSQPGNHDSALPRFSHGSRLSLAAALCLVSLVAVVGWFVLPAASITITPAAAELVTDVSLTADENVNTVDLAAGTIPARVVVKEVEGATTVSATGQRDVPNQPARGLVTFTNLTDQPLTVPKSTVLLAGKIAFFTIADSQVAPSLNVAGSALPGSGAASVQAADGGQEGNVAAGAITSVQGPLATKVTVVNRTPVSGGSNKKAAYLSADDQTKAKQALLEELRQRALDAIRGQIARNETFLPSPASAGDNAVEQLSYEDSPEQVSGQTRLHMKVLVRGLTFQGDDVNQVVSQRMDDLARQAGGASRLLHEPLTVQPPMVVSNDGSAIKLQVHTTGRAAAALNASQVPAKVRGQSALQAEQTLQKLPGVGRATVELWPGWASKVPSFPWRIHLAIAAPAGG